MKEGKEGQKGDEDKFYKRLQNEKKIKKIKGVYIERVNVAEVSLAVSSLARSGLTWDSGGSPRRSKTISLSRGGEVRTL
ncbi:hypothetical protein IF1G_05579 [Cordyceps javanica]|uniref:Uncharacterized protein n=1 Tax=Cordyceps javanica TaxID=43265 RepID=A0A545V205_9HYPO|nr:hypothetical protein IF1G_05579 [Cordyceps javanica]